MVDEEEMAAASAATAEGQEYLNTSDPSILRFLIAAREEVGGCASTSRVSHISSGCVPLVLLLVLCLVLLLVLSLVLLFVLLLVLLLVLCLVLLLILSLVLLFVLKRSFEAPPTCQLLIAASENVRGVYAHSLPIWLEM